MYLKINHIDYLSSNAESLADYLYRHPEIETLCSRKHTCHYYTTEAEEIFVGRASIFLRGEIEAQRINLEYY